MPSSFQSESLGIPKNTKIWEMDPSEFEFFLSSCGEEKKNGGENFFYEKERSGHSTTFIAVGEKGNITLVLVESHRRVTSQHNVVGWIAPATAKETEVRFGLHKALEYVIERARAHGHDLVKIDAEEQDSFLHSLAEDLGFSLFSSPVSDSGLEAPIAKRRAYLMWLDPHVPSRMGSLPNFLRQRTDFTCGPCSLLMGEDFLHSNENDPLEKMSFDVELELWREATYVMGCDAFGLGAIAADRGLSPLVLVSTEQPILADEPGGSFTPTAVNEGIHARLRNLAVSRNVAVQVGQIRRELIDNALRDGAVVLALIDQELLIGEHAAHWVLVWAKIGEDKYLVHDPWTQEYESWVETNTMPLQWNSLWDMSQWNGHRAFVVLSPASPHSK